MTQLIIEPIMDYKQMYNDKCVEFDELNLQFAQYQQEQSNFIITDLEQQNKEIKKKYEIIAKEISDLKEKKKNFSNSYEKEIELAKKEKQQFKSKFMDFEKKVIELENINESLESELRATKATLNEYEQRTEKTMEQLAFLQSQMQEATETNQEQIARLRSQLKETEQQLYALHHAKKKDDVEKQNFKNNQSFHSRHSEIRRSQIIDSKIKKRNPKFRETLAEVRAYIKEISSKREQLSQKYS